MDQLAYSRFNAVRAEFKDRVRQWSDSLPGLADAQRALALEAGDDYAIETPVVYNRALDDIGPDDSVSWIVVADNPGKREQEAGMNRYLVGRSGMVAERFFMRELGVDFRWQVVIINKTPVHTPKTVHLGKLAAIYPQVIPILEESQRFMASMVPVLQECFNANIWVMGLSEIRPRGIFGAWQSALLEACSLKSADSAKGPSKLPGHLFGFKHFSMGSFATDLKRRRLPGESTKDAVMRIGMENRSRILGDRFTGYSP